MCVLYFTINTRLCFLKKTNQISMMSHNPESYTTELKINLNHGMRQPPDLSSSGCFFCSPLWVFFYLGRASATPCAVCLTVLSQAPASASSPFVAMETISNGKVQASGLSGKKTEGIATDNHITLRDSYKIKEKIQRLGLSGLISETTK